MKILRQTAAVGLFLVKSDLEWESILPWMLSVVPQEGFNHLDLELGVLAAQRRLFMDMATASRHVEFAGSPPYMQGLRADSRAKCSQVCANTHSRDPANVILRGGQGK